MSTEEREDLHALYQACVADLSFFKSQQWSIANYTFLAYGGLFAAAQLTKLDSCWFKAALVALVVAVATSGVVLVLSLHRAIKVRQARLAFIRDKLTDTFRAAWEVMEKGSEFLNPVTVLCGALIAGGVLVALLIGFGPWRT